MPAVRETTCPGRGLTLPVTNTPAKPGYFNCSAECWVAWSEILAAEYGNVVVFGAVHQLTVDAYAVQHAGGTHPDKSVGIHLSGLHLVFTQGQRPALVGPLLKRLADGVETWPHFDPPRDRGRLTVADVSLEDPSRHIATVRPWAEGAWEAWSNHHAAVAELVTQQL